MTTILTPRAPIAPTAPLWLPASMVGFRASGVIEIEFAELADARAAGYTSRTVEIELVRCVHCRRDFKVSRGSGKRRGFCARCAGPTCGRPECDRHST